MNRPLLKLASSLLLILLFSFSINAQVTGAIDACEGDIEAYAVPTVAGASYSWSVTGGLVQGPSNLASVNILWGLPGTGTIVVTVNNPSGPPTFHTLNVTVHGKPNPIISYAPYNTCPYEVSGSGPVGQPADRIPCEKVCKNATVTYNTPLNASSTYLWVVNGASLVTGATTNSATVTWDTTFLGDITVYETNIWGCVDSFTLCIEKQDLPVAAFSHQASVCLFSNTLFTNLSTGATSYFWDFGDGGTSTNEDPYHSYTTGGTYTVTLIAYTDCYCTDTFQSTIVVDNLPGPTITCPSTLCADASATYSTAAAAGCTYNWFVIGGIITSGLGTPTITVSWGPGAIGTVGLYLSGCGSMCDDTTVLQIPIVPLTTTISGATKVCAGDCEYYSLPLFSGATYKWSLSSSGCGAIIDSTCCEKIKICWPSNLFSCVDTLNVTYFDSLLNCGGSAQIIIRLRPRLNIFGNPLVCANSSSSLSSSGGINCNWSVSPAGPTLAGSPGTSANISWNNLPGDYIVIATPVNPNDACNDTAYFKIKVVAPPLAPVITGDTIICPGSTLSYCTAPNPDILWIITGGTPATAIGYCTTVTWNLTGPYSIQAYQKAPNSPFCSSDTTLQNIYPFTPVPPVLLGPASACANATITYSTPTLYPPGTTYAWSLTPANAGAILSPGSASTSIEFGNNAPSSITVTLSVNVCGGLQTSNIVVTLNPAPTPTVNPIGSLCAGGTAQLQAVGGAFTSVNWSGPSGYSSVLNPTTITQDGLYQVTVTNANGCSGKSQYNVTYVSGPTASISSFDPRVYCIGDVYSATLCALGNPDYTYSWSPSGATQCITASTPGSYTVVVTDITNGCTATSNVITISEITCSGGGGGTTCQPNGSISFTHTGCNPVSFTNTSVSGSSFSWNFGDFTTSGLTSPSHYYAMAGFYLVSLTGNVPNAAGTGFCTLTDTAHIEIPLAADFDIVVGCDGAPVCFTDKSTYTAGNNITNWNWNFGDGNFSTLQDPCHTYASAGTYSVILTINNGSCSTADTINVIVPAGPTAAFTATSPNCLNNPVGFTDASFASINAWHWNFGDAGTSLNQNPNHTYGSPNVYPVTLIVSDIFGCKDTVVNPITVNTPTLSGSITAFPDTIVCAGTSVLLVAPTCAGCSYLWSNGSTNDSTTVTTTGIYSVTLTDGSGCPYSTFIRIIVNNGPPANIQNNESNEICLGSNILLYTTYNVNFTYSWITTDVVNNGSTNSSIFFTPVTAGTYTYQVFVTDTTTGCGDTSLPYVVTVNAAPVPPTITPLGPTTVCNGTTISLVATHPDPTVTFLWSTGEVNDTIVVTEGGCYAVEAIDTNGCSGQTQYCVTVNPLPDLCSFYEGCLDTCRPFIIHAPNGASHQWFLNGLPILGATAPTYAATLNGLYSVQVTNTFGCTDTTGLLDLTLTDCDTSLCGTFIVDSIYCDPAGNYVLDYRIVNNSTLAVTQVNLNILPPFLALPFAPSLVYTTIATGDTSIPLSTTIYGATAGDTLCFRAHLDAYDSTGTELLCCFTDTVCVTLPPCPPDSACCYFNFVSDSIWCEQTAVGPKFNFEFKINGCGNLQVQNGGTGVLNAANPYTLVAGLNTVSGSYIPSSPADTLMCLTFVVDDGMQNYCKDTTICFPINCKAHPVPCNIQYDREICEYDQAIFTYAGGPGFTLSWNFFGGTPPTATGPGAHNISYPGPGVYYFDLTLTNSAGSTTCRDSITVLAAPVASITQTGSTLYAAPAGMSYQWYGAPPTYTLIPGANNQFYAPTAEDVYCVVVTDAYGCKDTTCRDFLATGFATIETSDWNIYPNPNDGSFTLSLTANNNEIITMKLVNTLGEVVDTRAFDVRTGAQSFYVSNANLAQGIYFVQLITETGTSIRRVVVK
jgi:PKD repeat protein